MNKRFYTYIYLISFFLFPLMIIGQSQKLVRQGKKITDPKQKIEIFTKAIEVDDENLDAYFYRGLVKYDLQNYWGSILDFTKIIFSKPDADTFYNRGNAKYALGDFEGAYEDYVMAIKYNRDFFQAYYNLGMAQFNLHKYKQAVQSFIFLLKYFPDDVNTNIQLGLSLTELKQKELAILFLNKSISLEPNSDTYHNRGIAYLNMKDFKKAAADFKKAINLDKTNDSAYFYLGIAQLFDRDFTAAVKSFEDTLSFNSIDHETLVALAVANYHSENYDKAKHCFKKAKNILAAENEFHKYKNDISLFKETSWSIDEGYIFESYVERLNSL